MPRLNVSRASRFRAAGSQQIGIPSNPCRMSDRLLSSPQLTDFWLLIRDREDAVQCGILRGTCASNHRPRNQTFHKSAIRLDAEGAQDEMAEPSEQRQGTANCQHDVWLHSGIKVLPKRRTRAGRRIGTAKAAPRVGEAARRPLRCVVFSAPPPLHQ